ncbi:hypothetical protein DL769_003565 [Monosporascus sp. CRB-8-3]|nr:hypothetical protein DL769_003565 [Monosporascus sp. CRB-8-3]
MLHHHPRILIRGYWEWCLLSSYAFPPVSAPVGGLGGSSTMIDILRKYLVGLAKLKKLAFSRDTYSPNPIFAMLDDTEGYYSMRVVGREQQAAARARPELDDSHQGLADDETWERAHRNLMLDEADNMRPPCRIWNGYFAGSGRWVLAESWRHLAGEGISADQGEGRMLHLPPADVRHRLAG